LDHAALLQVLEAMKAAEVDDRIRLAGQTIYQALIDAELTHVIGAGPWEHTPNADGAAEQVSATTALHAGW
jgi:putative transposase